VRDVLVHAVDYQAGVGNRQHPGVWRRDRRTPQLAPMDVWVSGVGADTQIGMHGTDAQRGMVGVRVLELACRATDLAARVSILAPPCVRLARALIRHVT